jgi:hypothetical protein
MPKRSPTAKRPAKRSPLNLRTTLEQRKAIEESASRDGRSLVQQIEFLLELGRMVRGQTPDFLDLVDIKTLVEVAITVRETLRLTGEDGRRWHQYMRFADTGVYTGDSTAIERMKLAIAEEVDRRYEEAVAFIAVHGPAPLPHSYVRHPPGTSEQERMAAAMKVAEHRYFGRYVDDIDKGRAIAKRNALKAEKAYREKQMPAFHAIRQQIDQQQSIIDAINNKYGVME